MLDINIPRWLVDWAPVVAELLVAYVIYLELKANRFSAFEEKPLIPKHARNEALSIASSLPTQERVSHYKIPGQVRPEDLGRGGIAGQMRE